MLQVTIDRGEWRLVLAWIPPHCPTQRRWRRWLRWLEYYSEPGLGSLGPIWWWWERRAGNRPA
jgi:hypothetical protein